MFSHIYEGLCGVNCVGGVLVPAVCLGARGSWAAGRAVGRPGRQRLGLQASGDEESGGRETPETAASGTRYLVEPARRASLDQGLSHACTYRLVAKLRTAH